MRTKVYISGPITIGDRNHNFYQAATAEKNLMLAGYAPLNPMRSITLPFAWESCMPHSLWLECDVPWVVSSDVVLRLPGESAGADREVQIARRANIPIVYSEEELFELFPVAIKEEFCSSELERAVV